MNKRWGILAAALCVSLAFGGCQKESLNDGDTDKTNTNKTDSKVNEKQSNLDVLQPLAYGNVNGLNLEPGTTLSIIGRGSSSAYWKEVEAGAKQAVADINKALGYKGEDKVKLTYSAPGTENDVDDQVNILDEELARYPAAVGIAAVDSGACAVQFDLAAENNIPIVAFDSGVDYQDIAAMVDTNNLEAAATAARKLCDSIDDEGEIALFVHDSKSTSAKEREQGFLDEIAQNHPNVKVVKVYHLDELEDMQKEIAGGPEGGEQSGTEEPAEGADAPETEADSGSDITQEEVVEYILEKNPSIKGCYTTNEEAAKLVVGACETLERKDLKVISFDGGEDQLKLLEKEKLEGLIVQNPYGIGYATVVACARAVLGQGNEAVVDAGYTWVTKDNMEDAPIARMMY